MASNVLTVIVREAKDLTNLDNKDKTDPFVEIEIGGVKKKTKTIKNSLSPKWEETFEFPTNEGTEIVIKVFDDDPMVNDFVGQCIVPMNKVPVKDEWFQLKSKKEMPAGYIKVDVTDGRDQQQQARPADQNRPSNAANGANASRPSAGRPQDPNYDKYDRTANTHGVNYLDRNPSKYDRLYDRYEGRRLRAPRNELSYSAIVREERDRRRYEEHQRNPVEGGHYGHESYGLSEQRRYEDHQRHPVQYEDHQRHPARRDEGFGYQNQYSRRQLAEYDGFETFAQRNYDQLDLFEPRFIQNHVPVQFGGYSHGASYIRGQYPTYQSALYSTPAYL